MAVLLEPGREVHIAATVDVAVAGGGIAGVAAALAAARTGAQTLLLEKECALGGLATLGLIVMYLPLCDGYGHQVIGGIGEELLRKSVEGGSPTAGPRGHVPPCWNGPAGEEERAQTRFRVDYDAAPMMLTLERLLREAGVSIWYDTRLCAAQSREGKLSHVIVENKSGRLAIAAQAFVDATGDADLCFLAGERTESYLENRRSGWYFSMREGESAHLHPLTDPLKGPCPPGSRFYRLSGSEVSAYVEDMHDMIHAHASGQEGAAPFLIPALPLMRMTRRLCGLETLRRADLGCWRDDAVAMTGDWRGPAPVYTIGTSHLMGSTSNLFAAGRCISAAGDAWDVTRVIPTCAATGQAAGTMAALLALTGKLDAQQLRGQLLHDGVILDPSLTSTKGRKQA